MIESDKLIISSLQEKIEELEKRLNKLELVSNRLSSKNRIYGI